MNVIGVDVGSESVRAAIVRFDGFDRGRKKEGGQTAVLAKSTRPISILNPEPDIYIQSSGQIWRALCACVQVRQNLLFIYSDPSSHQIPYLLIGFLCRNVSKSPAWTLNR